MRTATAVSSPRANSHICREASYCIALCWREWEPAQIIFKKISGAVAAKADFLISGSEDKLTSRPGGETGRRTGLKIRQEYAHENAPKGKWMKTQTARMGLVAVRRKERHHNEYPSATRSATDTLLAMRFGIKIALGVFMLTPFVFGQAFEIKGEKLGVPAADFVAKHASCEPIKTSDGTEHCGFAPNAEIDRAMTHAIVQHHDDEAKRLEASRFTIGGSFVALMDARFYHGKLFQLSYYTLSSQYPDLKVALKSKFGEPKTVSKNTVQNGFGARYEGDEIFWSDQDALMVLSERSLVNVNWPVLTLTLKSVAEEVTKANQDKAKSDL